MQEEELLEKILDYIKTTYKAEYTGRASVKKNGTEYIFRIGIPSYMSPTSIAGSFETDDQFLEYIYEELRTRNYIRLYIYKVTREKAPNEE